MSIVTIASVSTKVTLSMPSALFNLSDLFRSHFKTSPAYPWRVAVDSFLVSPVVRGIIALLKKECPEVTLIKKNYGAWGEQTVYMHTGFISIALLELHVITSRTQNTVNTEVREVVGERIKQFYAPTKKLIVPFTEIPRERDIHDSIEVTNKVEALARSGQLMLGGVSVSVEPSSWIGIDAPKKEEKIPSLLTQDATAIVNGTLNILYTSLDLLLAKRSVMIAQCEEIETRLTPPPKRVDYQWSPRVTHAVDSLLRE